MQLQVRLIDAPACGGAKAHVLCDENGNMLPNQRACTVASQVGEATVVTVQFIVDGKRVSLAG